MRKYKYFYKINDITANTFIKVCILRLYFKHIFVTNKPKIIDESVHYNY